MIAVRSCRAERPPSQQRSRHMIRPKLGAGPRTRPGARIPRQSDQSCFVPDRHPALNFLVFRPLCCCSWHFCLASSPLPRLVLEFCRYWSSWPVCRPAWSISVIRSRYLTLLAETHIERLSAVGTGLLLGAGLGVIIPECVNGRPRCSHSLCLISHH